MGQWLEFMIAITLEASPTKKIYAITLFALILIMTQDTITQSFLTHTTADSHEAIVDNFELPIKSENWSFSKKAVKGFLEICQGDFRRSFVVNGDIYYDLVDIKALAKRSSLTKQAQTTVSTIDRVTGVTLYRRSLLLF